MPRVVDAEGRELKVGSEVRRPHFDMVGRVERIERRKVWVLFHHKPTAISANRLFRLRPTYRCPDLLLAQSNDERSE